MSRVWNDTEMNNEKDFSYCKANPHWPQYEEFNGFDFPHCVHTDSSTFPHPLQNFEFFGFC